VHATASLTPRPSPNDDILELNLFPSRTEVESTVEPLPPAPLHPEPASTLILTSLSSASTIETITNEGEDRPARALPSETAPIHQEQTTAPTEAEGSVDQTVLLSSAPTASDHEPEPLRLMLPQRPHLVLPSPQTIPNLSVREEARIEPAPAPYLEESADVESVPAAALEVVPDTARATKRPVQSPAEFAAAFVASSDARGSRERRSILKKIPVMPLVAVATVIVCAFVVWNAVVKQRVRNAPPAPAQQAQPTPTAAATSGPGAMATQPAAPKVDAAKKSGVEAPKAEVIADVKTPTQTPAPAQPQSATTGGFTLQVLSAKDQNESEASVGRLKGASADAYVMRADLGGRGVWYRVRIGRYQSRAEAQAAGSKLVAAGRISTFIIVPFEPEK